MEDFISKIELRFNNRKIEFENLNFISSDFLKPGCEIWQILYFKKTKQIKEIKLTTILKPQKKI